MSEWTPDEVKKVLRSRERARLQELGSYLLRAAEAGHVNFLYRRPWLRFGTRRSKEEDVQDTVLTLLRDGERLLFKYGERPEFTYTEHALRKYVIGITWNVLQKRYQDRAPRWEVLEQDLGLADGEPTFSRAHARHDQAMDLESAVFSLSPRDQELFEMLYVRQFEPEDICTRRGILRNALEAQKSRLLKRLLRFIRGETGSKEGGDE